jgi:hypothetical protein
MRFYKKKNEGSGGKRGKLYLWTKINKFLTGKEFISSVEYFFKPETFWADSKVKGTKEVEEDWRI